MLLLAVLVSMGAAVRGAESSVARLMVDTDAVVRVTDADLRGAGFVADPGQLSRLRLRSSGEEVSLLLESPAGPGAGAFAIRFLGRHRRGPFTEVSPYGAINAYLLDLASSARHRLRVRPGASAPARPGSPRSEESSAVIHFERDLRFIDFTGDEQPAESWYWEEIRATDQAPVEVGVALPALDRTRPLTLRARLMGYTSLPGQPDHQVEVLWNGTAVGRATWDGRRSFSFEATIDGARAREGENEVGFDARGAVRGRIDSMLLDWLDVAFTRRNELGPGGRGEVSAIPGRIVVIRDTGEAPIELWDTRAPRVWRGRRAGRDTELLLAGRSTTPIRLLVTREGEGVPPLRTTVRPAADLRSGGADFVIVCPDALAPAANRLAEARRRQGLVTRTVRIEDVYDGFSGGQLDPAALRAFLRQALRRWSPRPSYVLLMGDASWDYRGLLRPPAGAEALAEVPAPAPGEPPGRLRVPTLRYRTSWGSGASDGLLLQAEGEYGVPDVAVGRFPAATLAEAEAMVEKTLAHDARLGAPGGVLLLADHVGEHRDACARLAASAGALGFRVEPLCGGPALAGDVPVWKRAFSALGRGLDLALFVGHGSRDLLQTGPLPDTSKDQDVLTWKHLDSLPRASVLPVFLALSCDVAPFDHPWADSIGEKLLRMPDRGAVAVIAPSRRTPPAYALAGGFLAALASGRAPRLGDLFLAALRSTQAIDVRYSYNLLGDPTLPVHPGGTAEHGRWRETEVLPILGRSSPGPQPAGGRGQAARGISH